MKDWGGRGEAYAASYAALCAGTAEPIMSMLGEPAGRTLLDVGSGTGLLTAALADAGWTVTGCEPEPMMRAVAAREHPALPMSAGALPSLPFADGAYDAVVANFVLNHVADPRVAARELARVSRDALAATIWSRSPTWLWLEVCERAGLQPAAGERLPPDKDFERSAEGFARMLRDAGWRDVEVAEHTWTWHAAPTALWASAEGGVGGAGLFYLSLSAVEQGRFRDAFDRICAERANDGRIPLEHTAAVAAGRRG